MLAAKSEQAEFTREREREEERENERGGREDTIQMYEC